MIGGNLSKFGIVLIVLIIITSNTVLATSYNYDQKIPIVSQGKEIGYVEPYYESTLFGNYAYLKWQRYGFSVGNSFPIFLIEGTTTALPFGIEGEFLRVIIGKITSNSVSLVIDQSSITQEIEDIVDEIDEGIEDITEQTESVIEDIIDQSGLVIDNINLELENLNSQIRVRIQKAIDRGYYSSLHIIDQSNQNLKAISNKIKAKEAELAEKIEDKIISILLDTFVAPGSSITYTTLINQIPSAIRHDITTFLYNIDSKSDDSNEIYLASEGVATLYIGNPTQNKISAQFNNQLKNLGLPYFEGDKIIGKRSYSLDDIGIIATIPEEKYWGERTLQQRWDNDKVRLYKTLIAGNEKQGLETAANWYNKQLDLAKDFISSSLSLTGDVELDDVFNIIKDTAIKNPEASISFATITQGWVLTAISGLQNQNFENVDSLGYVVIVKKNGNGYKTLETYSIQGDKISSFIGDYEEIGEEVLDEITGQAVDNQQNRNSEENIKNSEGNSFVNFIKTIWRKIFG